MPPILNRVNHKYYSTHALFKDFEPIRRSEYFAMPFDDPEHSYSKAYDLINNSIEEARVAGKRLTDDDVMDIIKDIEPETYKAYVAGEIGFDDDD